MPPEHSSAERGRVWAQDQSGEWHVEPEHDDLYDEGETYCGETIRVEERWFFAKADEYPGTDRRNLCETCKDST